MKNSNEGCWGAMWADERFIGSKAFESTIAAPSQGVISSSGLTIKADIDFKTVSSTFHFISNMDAICKAC